MQQFQITCARTEKVLWSAWPWTQRNQRRTYWKDSWFLAEANKLWQKTSNVQKRYIIFEKTKLCCCFFCCILLSYTCKKFGNKSAYSILANNGLFTVCTAPHNTMALKHLHSNLTKNDDCISKDGCDCLEAQFFAASFLSIKPSCHRNLTYSNSQYRFRLYLYIL